MYQPGDPFPLRRKPPLRPLTALLALAIGVWACCLSCQEPPLGSLAEAKAALDWAAEANAGRFAPGAYDSACCLLRTAELETARQRGRPRLFRDYEAADSLCRSACKAALEAGATAAARAAEQLATLGDLQEQVERELASWRATLNGSLVVYAAEQAHASAEIALQKGRTLLSAREYPEAAEAFGLAQQSIDDLVRIMDGYAYERSGKLETWRGWARDTIQASGVSGSAAIIVDKHAHRLYLLHAGRVARTYACELGYNSAGQKIQAGDGATPEGRYRITHVIARGSKFYKALRLNYPNDADRRRFLENRRAGVISTHANIGGLIEVHGDGGRNKDWTDGCVALTNKDMDHLIEQVTVGTPVTIVRTWDEAP